MAATVFATPQNNCSTTVGAAGYTAGSGNLVLVAGGGTLFPLLSGGNYCRVTVIQTGAAYVPNAPASTYTIFRVLSFSGDNLVLGGTLEGTTDRNYAAGDVVEIRVTEGTLIDLQTAVNTLETTTTPLVQPTIAIAGAITMTAANFGCVNVCSGTTANYTVTLPSPTSNAGRSLTLAMAPGLTKLVTIARNAADLIDGATSRVMWANETATLFCDGTNWTKLSGKTMPMICELNRTAALNIPFNANTTIALDTMVTDSTGQMADPTTNHRINIVRASSYMCSASVGYSPITNSSNTQALIRRTGGAAIASNSTGTPTTGVSTGISVIGTAALAIADFVYLDTYQSQGAGTAAALITGSGTHLNLVEIPQW